MTRLKALLKKADKAAVIGMTAAAVAMAALGAGGVKTYASDYSVQKYVDSSDESLVLDGDTWHCYKNGQIDYDYDGIALNEYGWWKVNNGEVDFSYSGMVLNQYGWWYVNNGGLDGSYSGMGVNEYGWWKYDNGTVDFGYNGFAADGENTWYVVNGRVATEYSGTVDGKEVRNGQVMDTIVIQVVHHDRDRTGAVTEGNPDTSGLVGYTEYLAVPVDKEGNITEPVYISYWCPDDYEGFTSGYIITASAVTEDGIPIDSKEVAQRTDIRPYIKDGVLNVYMSWFMM